ncbi:hypothetical protein [Chitinophaga ginsengisoli]|uniref:Uncharacterized protein n=1 Tax=Chitinophaga ginsengisoli TaxID=363837 RepID=A0A2P8G2G8_9BACT|nr:hypothetical protein [Chitinophaga ginsengisoli]PSL28161.1 hypothetical protein CLV42_10880 [Chitinophaga ginsengisoli]
MNIQDLKDIFDLAIYNRFRMGKAIAAELDPTAAHLRRWIVIYQPEDRSLNINIPEHVYNVHDFELEKEKMTEFIGDEDLIMCNERRYYLNTVEELINLLLDLHINPKLLTYPWRCDCPF